ncbi:MAG: AIR synthase family protein [Anaerolineae bacterium]
MTVRMLEVGKLPMELLDALLTRYGGHDERLVVGPRVGEDAAVLDMGQRYLVVKSDPITFATDEIGWYVVHINANDLATTGAKPRWMLLTLLLPERKTSTSLVEQIFAQVHEACEELGIALCGGHTEITHGLDRPIAIGLLLGEVERQDLVQTAGVQVGDTVILTKGIAVEGTAVLAREFGQKLEERVGTDLVARGQRFLTSPGISILRDAEIIRQVERPHAMHDPTEGGLATGLWELALASNTRLIIDLEAVHVYPETAAFCQALGLDPLGVLASGALLATAPRDSAQQMVTALDAAGIQAAVIGSVEEGPARVDVKRAGGVEALPTFERDELAQLFG